MLIVGAALFINGCPNYQINYQSLCLCPFECGIEPCKITLIKHHIIVNHSSGEHIEHDKKDYDANTTVEEDNIIRRTFMLSPKLVTSSVNSREQFS